MNAKLRQATYLVKDIIELLDDIDIESITAEEFEGFRDHLGALNVTVDELSEDLFL
jgi:hypothetical protein